MKTHRYKRFANDKSFNPLTGRLPGYSVRRMRRQYPNNPQSRRLRRISKGQRLPHLGLLGRRFAEVNQQKIHRENSRSRKRHGLDFRARRRGSTRNALLHWPLGKECDCCKNTRRSDGYHLL